MVRLKNFWYIAAPSVELKRRPIRRVVEGETVALFRDTLGKCHALRDRCVHRGMALSAGRVVGSCIQCPYHGWQYDSDGHIRSVPALCDTEDLPTARTRSFPVREQDDHIWVWIGDEEPTTQPFHFPRYGEHGWSTFFMQTRFNAPVELCLENFLDVPHTLFVHPGLFRKDELRNTRAQVRTYKNGVEAEFMNEAPLEGIGPRLLFPRGTKMEHTDRFILPSISRVDYRFGDAYQFIISSQCTQRDDDVVDVVTAITWRLPLPAIAVGPFLRWYCRRVIQQDVETLEIQGEQLRRFGRCDLHTSADLLGRQICELRRQAIEGLNQRVDVDNSASDERRAPTREFCREIELRI